MLFLTRRCQHAFWCAFLLSSFLLILCLVYLFMLCVASVRVICVMIHEETHEVVFSNYYCLHFALPHIIYILLSNVG